MDPSRLPPSFDTPPAVSAAPAPATTGPSASAAQTSSASDPPPRHNPMHPPPPHNRPYDQYAAPPPPPPPPPPRPGQGPFGQPQQPETHQLPSVHGLTRRASHLHLPAVNTYIEHYHYYNFNGNCAVQQASGDGQPNTIQMVSTSYGIPTHSQPPRSDPSAQQQRQQPAAPQHPHQRQHQQHEQQPAPPRSAGRGAPLRADRAPPHAANAQHIHIPPVPPPIREPLRDPIPQYDPFTQSVTPDPTSDRDVKFPGAGQSNASAPLPPLNPAAPPHLRPRPTSLPPHQPSFGPSGTPTPDTLSSHVTHRPATLLPRMRPTLDTSANVLAPLHDAPVQPTSAPGPTNTLSPLRTSHDDMLPRSQPPRSHHLPTMHHHQLRTITKRSRLMRGIPFPPLPAAQTPSSPRPSTPSAPPPSRSNESHTGSPSDDRARPGSGEAPRDTRRDSAVATHAYGPSGTTPSHRYRDTPPGPSSGGPSGPSPSHGPSGGETAVRSSRGSGTGEAPGPSGDAGAIGRDSARLSSGAAFQDSSMRGGGDSSDPLGPTLNPVTGANNTGGGMALPAMYPGLHAGISANHSSASHGGAVATSPALGTVPRALPKILPDGGMRTTRSAVSPGGGVRVVTTGGAVPTVAATRGRVDESFANDWQAVVEMYMTGRGTVDGVALKKITKGDGRRVVDRKLLEKRRTIGKTYECLGPERFEAAIGYKFENGVRRKQKMYHVISRCRVVNAMRKNNDPIPVDFKELTALIDERIAEKEAQKEAQKEARAAGAATMYAGGTTGGSAIRRPSHSGTPTTADAASSAAVGVETTTGGGTTAGTGECVGSRDLSVVGGVVSGVRDSGGVRPVGCEGGSAVDEGEDAGGVVPAEDNEDDDEIQPGPVLKRGRYR